MKGFLLFVVGGVVGAVATFFLAVGVGAGAGIVTGVKAGACLTVEAAKEQGFISEDEVNQVLAAAAKQIADSGTEVPDITGGGAACQTFIAELKQAASD